jgi:hypothetical protein
VKSTTFSKTSYESGPKFPIERVLLINALDVPATRRIAVMLATQSVKADLAYFQNREYSDYSYYNQAYKINNIHDLIDLIKDPNYDLIHGYGEQNIGTCLSIAENRPTVHDAVDIASMRNPLNNTETAVEYMALTKAHGGVFVTDWMYQSARQQFGFEAERPFFILGNPLIREIKPKARMRKLSEGKDELHLVYEGGLSADITSHRYIEPILIRVAQMGIHMHFYTIFSYEDVYYQNLAGKSDYLHWHGIVPHDVLMEELTQYDAGLIALNFNPLNISYMAHAMPNKLYDYLIAGLPIAVSGIPVFGDYIEEHGFGKNVDFNADFRSDLFSVKNIKIADSVMRDNGFIADEYAEPLSNFYRQVLSYYNRNSV